ncbi:tRNA pseudouridine(38-40) synthase TruA [Aureivirga marina]|uniref:tRNA pseudouridine(38-40) synthase TruA n=1 Tax=Aureivirga marina TaxID=1182451 RepID=UPI0018CA5E0E|nr:tRNA pseudouridine(38-40) synthase TruA [Aureivirga marina]
MYTHYYLLHIQFLGFRFHGWQPQPKLKTVQLMLEKTICFVLKHEEFKVLGSGRTDAMVSANKFAVELFLKEEIDTEEFLEQLNKYLPSDLKLLTIEKVSKEFNIIQNSKVKEYIYLFSHKEKAHPFSAPFVTTFVEELDISLMKEGAKLFKGEHFFHKYCTKPSPETNFQREILESCIEENTIYQANFFPKESYVFRIKSKGFLRYQVRLIMGMLFELGRGNVSLEEIEASLKETNDRKSLRYIAPNSGLSLHDIEFL